MGHAAARQEGVCPVLQVSSEQHRGISYINLFSCHEAGAAALLHASQHHLLISAGKKGQVCIWDVRQARLLHSFKVKNSILNSVYCMRVYFQYE